MKIYTKSGDQGKTSLFGGTRVPKYHLRIEAYGTIDELNSLIGLIRDQKIDSHSIQTLIKIQTELFVLGAMLATDPEKERLKTGKARLNIATISPQSVAFLENEIDEMNESLPAMTHFILPGGHTTVSFCHMARCVCRRAERIVSHLSDESTIDSQILVYLNRLSDYLFMMARKLTIENKVKEIPWIPEKKN